MPAEPIPFAAPGTPQHWIRQAGVRIRHVGLRITVDLDRSVIEGTVTHIVEALAIGPIGQVVFDQHGLTIGAVRIGDQPATWSVAADQVAVVLPAGDRRGPWPVAIDFTCVEPVKGMYFVRPDPRRGRVAMAWTQGAMCDHSHWFPCFDDPNNLSTFDVSIRHRSQFQAISNGEAIGRTDHGDGWSTTVYRQDQPHVLYLLNVVVGDLEAHEQAGAAVPITHYLPRGARADALAMFRATPFAIGWLGAFCGLPFPWHRYGHVVVHGFMWGGMENATLTTITDRVLMDAQDQAREDVDCDPLVIHELVHQWFGDLLTMKSWSDIWLNESFATYLEARGTAAWRGQGDGNRVEAEFALELWTNRQQYLEEDRDRYRRPLVTNRYHDAYELFDRVAYEKGSLVLHHLCRVLGEDRFRAGLALYLKRHAHGLVETADFRRAMEDAGGTPIDWFLAQWLDRAGHPRLKVRQRHDPVRHQIIVEIEQLQAAGDPALVYRLPTTLSWARQDGTIQRLELELTKVREVVVVGEPDAPRWVSLDPDGHVPAEWDEEGDPGDLLARIGEPRLGAIARARGVVAMGGRLLTAPAIERLARIPLDAQDSELVRLEVLGLLGRSRSPRALQALLAAYPAIPEARVRRAAAKAIGQHTGSLVAAAGLMALLEAEPSAWARGEILAARGALEVGMATPALRSHLGETSWQERLRVGCVRGLGQSGEAAALDEVLPMIAREEEHDAVRQAACAALGALGSRHLLARERVRRALEPLLDHPILQLRVAAARALGELGDPHARAALGARQAREIFGNVSRVLREVMDRLDRTAASTATLATMGRRVEELEASRRNLEQRLEALEKRLDAKT